MNEIYKRIKQRREELGMSQEELATMMGYKNRSSIHKIETGVNDIPNSKIGEFAKALKTTPWKLMGLKEEKTKDGYEYANDDNNLCGFTVNINPHRKLVKTSYDIQKKVKNISCNFCNKE